MGQFLPSIGLSRRICCLSAIRSEKRIAPFAPFQNASAVTPRDVSEPDAAHRKLVDA